ncbi:interleukin-11 receptor subunit alpha [Electrophorus electricus]|uniref:Fibronectin type-III domain-containing protein n=1 Tax=Electrophorus electricus TaxID=8005 RepID=A0A4W4E017_ELEEL|nr:interleukin-11 receptor subunit alpha [Electrophorus electricus]
MPGLSSRPGGLVVIGILTLSFVHINSEIWSNEVADVQFGHLGSSITLACGAASHGSPVQWWHNGSSVQPWRTSGEALTLLNTTRSMEGNYSCHEQSGALLQTVRLRLGYPPGHLRVSCQVPSHSRIICSWMQIVATHLPTEYISSYRVDNGWPESCKQELAGVNECTISNPQFWGNRHIVNITEVNPLGSMSTFTKVDVLKNLKPDVPEALSTLEVEGQPTQLLVQWKAPVSWSDDIAFPLKFELQYRPVGSNLWSKLETEDTSVTIMDAMVGQLHHIQVRAQDAFINHSQWSEWSHMVQGRPWSNPYTSTEETTAESFDESVFPTTFPVKATNKSPEMSPENESLSLLLIISLFAAAMVAVVSTITLLLWVRNRKQHNVTKQELTSMVKMKSLPI